MLGLALSGGLHLLVAMVVPQAPAGVSAAPVSFSELRFETLPVDDEPPPAEPALHQATPPAPPHVPPRRVPPHRARRPESQPSAPSELTPAVSTGPDLSVNTPPAPAPPLDPVPLTATERAALSASSARRMGLDPRAVALSGYVPAPNPPTAHSVDAESAGRASREAAEAALDADLAQANHVPGQRHRPPPRLLRRSDGGFLWRGAGISAGIMPNGEVSFSDRPGFRYDGENPGASSMPAVGFRFDITDPLERRHGNDPYYADRRWFMRETRQLRRELAARADAERTLHEDRRLLGRLRRIAQDEALSLEARHRAVVRLWSECAHDEPGERARQRILRFVHDELPRGSAEAFTSEELDALNAGRTPRFEPYR